MWIADSSALITIRSQSIQSAPSLMAPGVRGPGDGRHGSVHKTAHFARARPPCYRYYVPRSTTPREDKTSKDSGAARYSDPPLLVLASLADGSKHGHAMIEDIMRMSGTRLGPGTLYGAIAHLERDGLIEPLPPDDRRRPY